MRRRGYKLRKAIMDTAAFDQAMQEEEEDKRNLLVGVAQVEKRTLLGYRHANHTRK